MSFHLLGYRPISASLSGTYRTEPLREWWTCKPWTEEVANAPIEVRLWLVFNDTSTSSVLIFLQPYSPPLSLCYLCLFVLLRPKHGPRAWYLQLILIKANMISPCEYNLYVFVQTLYLKFYGWTAKSYALVDEENEAMKCFI